MKVSKRIKEICDYIPFNAKVADVGCDHGYLILEAFLTKNIKFAQLIDNKKPPLDKARENLKNINIEIKYTLSDGLDELCLNVDTIVLAGMGGVLIKEILKKNIEKLDSKLIIIQANSNLERLREFLYKNYFFPIFEKVIIDRSHFYQIMAIKKDTTIVSYTYEDIFLGKKLKHSKTSDFKAYCEFEIKKLINIDKQLNNNIVKIEIKNKIFLLNKFLKTE